MADSKPNAPRPMVVGANHRSSSMGIRDRLFVEDAEVAGVLERLRDAGIKEAMVVSTCDRVEIQAVHEDPTRPAGRAGVCGGRVGRSVRAWRIPDLGGCW